MFKLPWRQKLTPKSRQWIMDPNPIDVLDPKVIPYPPTLRKQIRSAQDLLEGPRPFTVNAQLAVRYTDENILRIRVPSGLTRQDRESLKRAIEQIVSLTLSTPAPQLK